MRLLKLQNSVFLIICTICIIMWAGCRNNGYQAGTSPSLPTLSIEKYIIEIEIARTAEERGQGLKGRKDLAENRGMLFVYPAEHKPSFWMKDTLIPLSIAFIDKEGKIVDIQSMQPETLDPHTPPVPILYALEMKNGWFRERGLRKGVEVFGLPSPENEKDFKKDR